MISHLVDSCQRGQYVVNGMGIVTLRKFVMENQHSALKTNGGSMGRTVTTMDGRFAIRANALHMMLSAKVSMKTQLPHLPMHFAMNMKVK